MQSDLCQLPTIVDAIGSKLKPSETLPLDGISLWDAFQTPSSVSPRTEIYYGISQQKTGPAVRDVWGNKLILGEGGGGKGQWSPQQLPNASLAQWIADLTHARATGQHLYNVTTDPGEHNELPLDQAVVDRLMEIVVRYNKSKVPQKTGDPSCPKFKPLTSPQGPWIGPWCD